MDSFVSESDEKLPSNQSHKLTKKRKIRRTEELNFNNCLDTSEKITINKSVKKIRNNSFLPKIDEISLMPDVVSHNSKNLTSHQMKRKKNLQMYKQKLEQMHSKLLLSSFKSKSYKADQFVETEVLDNKSFSTMDINYSDFYRKCFVIVQRLSSLEIEKALRKNADRCDTSTHNVETSSTLDFEMSNQNKQNTDALDSTNIENNSDAGMLCERRLSCTLENPVNNVDLMKSFCDSNGTPMKIEKQAASRIRFSLGKQSTHLQDLPSEETLDFNTTFEVQQSQDEKTESKAIHQKTNKSSRNKQRVTFSNNVQDSPWRNENINSPRRFLPQINSPTPLKLTPLSISKNINDASLRRNSTPIYYKSNAGHTPAKSILKNDNSNKKIVKKGMPDYAKIHQKMFDKMLSIQEYNEQKIQRAKLLLSGRKPSSSSKKENIEAKRTSDSKVDVAKKLTFSSNESKPLLKKKLSGKNPRQIRKISKSPTKRKEDQLIVANKAHLVKNSKENTKTELNGIRTNRRFELLMKYRKKQGKN